MGPRFLSANEKEPNADSHKLSMSRRGSFAESSSVSEENLRNASNSAEYANVKIQPIRSGLPITGGVRYYMNPERRRRN